MALFIFLILKTHGKNNTLEQNSVYNNLITLTEDNNWEVNECIKNILNKPSEVSIDLLYNYNEKIIWYLHWILIKVYDNWKWDIKYKSFDDIKNNIENYYVLIYKNKIIWIKLYECF